MNIEQQLIEPIPYPPTFMSNDIMKEKDTSSSSMHYPQNQHVETDEHHFHQCQLNKSMDSAFEQSWEEIHHAQRKQYMAQYRMTTHFEQMLEQYQQKERYWKERTMYVEEQLHALGNLLREVKEKEEGQRKPLSRIVSANDDVDKDEIIRSLQAKIASRDAVIESLEDKVQQKDRLIQSTSSRRPHLQHQYDAYSFTDTIEDVQSICQEGFDGCYERIRSRSEE